MKKQKKENQENKTIKITDLLSDEEIKKLTEYYKNNQWNEARKYLNEEERKIHLKNKGVISNYLYYYLFYIFSNNKV